MAKFARSGARVAAWPLFGLALWAMPAAAAPPVLPAGGTVVAGEAGIAASSASALTITQSSPRAIVDWSGFAIGAGGSVRFENGAGATLNRVTGADVSRIDGTLSASGSVYLINPNGVVIGRSGVVDVGGSFVASTLGLSNDAFLAGGDLDFAGASGAAVINLGRVGALGGDVALIAATVENRGDLAAAGGTVGLAAGSDVLLRDAAVDGGRFLVRFAAPGTSVANAGTIRAAAAELRANGGSVYALAGDAGGLIDARGVAAHDGRIWLTAGDTGTVGVAGTLTARGTDGAAGAIETSGGTVAVGAARIDAGPGGTWLLDPADLIIDQPAANTIAGTLNAGTNVTQQTSAAGAGGAGDIVVNPNVAIGWSTSAALTLSAYRNVALGDGATIASSGGGAVTLYADNTGAGTGSVTFGSGARVSTAGAVNIYYDPVPDDAAILKYYSPVDYSRSVTGGGALTAYMLVNSVADLNAMASTSSFRLAGSFALGRDIDVAGANLTPIGSAVDSSTSGFTGLFDGQGHSIANLGIGASYNYSYTTPGPSLQYAGLFGMVTGNAIIRNLNLVGGRVGLINNNLTYGTGATAVGALVGVAFGGTISNVSSTVSVVGTSVTYAGGLVGLNNNGTILNSYASGNVTGASTTLYYTHMYSPTTTGVFKTANVGGLVGGNGGAIRNSYATGKVDGSGANVVGGFVGYNSGQIAGAYASGAVTGGTSTGGFVGVNASNANSPAATIDNGYWDEGTTGQILGYTSNSGTITRLVGIGGDTGYSPYAQATYTHFSFGAGGAWVILDGQTRPLLATEYATRIATAHQLQLVATNLNASYTLANDIDLSATGTGSDVWNPATGFAPIGSAQTPFTGSLAGGNRMITGLSITRPSETAAGLFGYTRGAAVADVTLAHAVVVGGDYTGVLAGSADTSGFTNISATGTVNAATNVNAFGGGSTAGGLIGIATGGTLTDSDAAVSVAGRVDAGGLVGSSTAAISRSTSAGAVFANGFGGEGGGLVGYNGGSVTDSYATGQVSIFVTGNNPLVAGLVGRNDGTIATSYASGRVSGSPGLAAGLVGRNNGSVTGSYWDSGTTGQSAAIQAGSGTGGVTPVGGTSGNSAYAAASYAALDFSATGPWVILEGATRPLLRSEYATKITTAHQLQLVATNPYVDYTLAADLDLGVTANASEIWNPATGFAPIGAAAAPFTGTLDGGGHTLANLTIARAGADNVGLFAGLGNTGTVRNLTLTGVSVTGAGNVGGVAGFSTGTIAGVRLAGSVAGTNSAGGLVGYNLGTITSSSASPVTVTATNFAGGLVGYNAGTLGNAANPVSAQGRVTATGSYAGGLAGYNDAGATVSGSFGGTQSVSAHDYAGGIAGFSGGSIVASIANAPVVATRGAGGLVGFNTGTVAGSSASATVSAADLAGGFAGVNFGTIANQSASGDVSGYTQLGGFAGANASGGVLTNVAASGSVTGRGTLGGLVGYNDGAIAGSHATGAVGAGGANFVGGLVGYNARTISASYASGAVNGATWVGGLAGYSDTQGRIANSGTFNAVSGVDYAGGLAGYNGGTIDSSNTNGSVVASGRGAGGLVGYNVGTIVHAYALGSVRAPVLAGGLLGLNFGQVATSFASGSVSGTDSVGGLVGANAGALTDVYATARVDGRTQVGGLVGYTAARIMGAYATGAVTGTDAGSTGGLAGYADTASMIAQAYAAGAVATGGGVAGTNAGTLSAVFYDAGTTGAAGAVTSGSAAGTAAVGGATGRSAYAQASYPGLDFLDVWTIQQGQSRPTLQDNPQNPAPK